MMMESDRVELKEAIASIIFDYDYNDPEARPHEEECNGLAEEIMSLIEGRMI